jgi:endo-1,4-beta-mannosidase
MNYSSTISHPSRREFVKSSSLALAAGTLLNASPEIICGETTETGLMRHRFGLNYVPSQNWYYSWNDWKPESTARDFDSIAAVGADHIRIMLIWPWFQPNPGAVSTAHLDHLDAMMHLAAQRKLDVLVTLYNGWLSGFAFAPPYLAKEPFYTSAKWEQVQELFLAEVSKRMTVHENFMGFDIANEINCIWSCEPADGDAWMERVFKQMHALAPGRIHVNGADENPWTGVTTFSPQALLTQQKIVPLHCYPHFMRAAKYGTFMQKPSTDLLGAFAALARSYGNAPGKPIWIQEFGMFNQDLQESDIPRWMEIAVTKAVAGGVSWFTWWGSHDIERRFRFDQIEYSLGLITVDNKIKEQGRMFKRLADSYRGKLVAIPDKTLPPPPAERTLDASWRWMLDWMEYKA